MAYATHHSAHIGATENGMKLEPDDEAGIEVDSVFRDQEKVDFDDLDDETQTLIMDCLWFKVIYRNDQKEDAPKELFE
jgi:hypothetical protein